MREPAQSIGAGASSHAKREIGAHHTSFSYAVTAEHLWNFAEMAGVEFLLMDENTRVEEFKDKLRWNNLYYHLNRAL